VLLFQRRTDAPEEVSFPFSHLEYVVEQAFQHRRKMLRHAFKAMGIPEKEAGLDPTARAEDISVSAYCQWAETLWITRGHHVVTD
jgi:16S rRNA A1518/A1519 N6-dimethyltransferase RsmA/KsgA/DIM1 with predicted DNA glycosylase/AP lyase activity